MGYPAIVEIKKTADCSALSFSKGCVMGEISLPKTCPAPLFIIKSEIAVNIKSDGITDCAESDKPRITPCLISAEKSKTVTAVATTIIVKISFLNFSV